MCVVDIRRSWDDLGIKNLNLESAKLAPGSKEGVQCKLTKL